MQMEPWGYRRKPTSKQVKENASYEAFDLSLEV